MRITTKSYGWFCPWISAGWFLDCSKAEAGCMGMGICPWESCIYGQNCRIVQTQLLQSQKKRGKENFAVIGQVNAVFEGSIKSTVQGTFITLTCCRTTEMKKRQHSEGGNKDIMMGNTTFKCQWNGQFQKPSGKQVVLKHDNLLNGFPPHLLPFFFFFPAVPQWILSWFLVQKRKGRGKNVKQGSKAWNVSLPRWGR